MGRRRRGKTRLLVPGRDIAWGEIGRRLVEEFQQDAVDDIAATVTFYCVLSLFPLLLCTVGVISKVVSWETIEQVVHVVSRVAPHDVTRIVSERLTTLKSQPATGLLTVSFVGALWSASAGVGSLIPALDRAYDVVETRPFWRRKLLAIGVTLGIGAMALAASLVALAIPAVQHWLGPLGVVLGWLRLPVSGAMMMFTWGLLYMVLPNVRPRFQPVTPGSVVGVLLWVGASWGFGQYAQRFGQYEVTYGALGGVIVLLLWMWVSTMALLLGAMINKILMPEEDMAQVKTHVANMPHEAQEQSHAAAVERNNTAPREERHNVVAEESDPEE